MILVRPLIDHDATRLEFARISVVSVRHGGGVVGRPVPGQLERRANCRRAGRRRVPLQRRVIRVLEDLDRERRRLGPGLLDLAPVRAHPVHPWRRPHSGQSRWRGYTRSEGRRARPDLEGAEVRGRFVGVGLQLAVILRQVLRQVPALRRIELLVALETGRVGEPGIGAQASRKQALANEAAAVNADLVGRALTGEDGANRVEVRRDLLLELGGGAVEIDCEIDRRSSRLPDVPCANERLLRLERA